MEKEKLFKEFPPVSKESWKDKINTDLKGADFERKLVWKTGEGFNVQPFYTESDLEKHSYLEVCPGDFPFLRGQNIQGNKWLVRQDIKIDDIKEANARALDIRLKGVDSFCFEFKKGYVPTTDDIEHLLHNIRLDLMEINFDTEFPLEILQIIDQLARKYNRDLDKVSGSLSYDPLGFYSATGKFHSSHEKDFSLLSELINFSAHLPNFQVITVDGSLFHNAGSLIVSQLAFTLAKGADYLTYLTGKGIDVDTAAP